MKLFLTLEDDDGQKVERILQARANFGDVDVIAQDMIDSLAQSKKPL